MTFPLIDGVDPMHGSADGACHGVGLTSGNGEPRIESHMILRARCHHGIGPFFVAGAGVRAMFFGDAETPGFRRSLLRVCSWESSQPPKLKDGVRILDELFLCRRLHPAKLSGARQRHSKTRDMDFTRMVYTGRSP
jgi:hypothetical protein